MQNILRTSAALVMLLWIASASHAQSALELLEESLSDTPPAPRKPRQGPGEAARAEPGYLGAVTDDRQENGRGVRVMEVVAGGPAEQGGLQANDLITGINDEPVQSLADLAEAIRSASIGEQLRLEVQRGGEQLTIEVTLGRRPPSSERRFGNANNIPEEPEPPAAQSQPARSPSVFLGIVARPVTEETRRLQGLPVSDGALVSELVTDSPAASAGVPLGAVIVALNGAPIANPSDLAKALAQAQPGDEIELTLYRGRKLLKLPVTLAAANGGVPAADNLPSPEPLDPGPVLEPEPVEEADGEQTPIERLEQRIEELERRLREVEQRLEP